MGSMTTSDGVVHTWGLNFQKEDGKIQEKLKRRRQVWMGLKITVSFWRTTSLHELPV